MPQIEIRPARAEDRDAVLAFCAHTWESGDDLDEIVHYLNASSIFPALGGFYYLGFRAYSLTAEFLEEKIAAQQVFLLHRWNRLDGLAIAEQREWEHGGKQLSVGYIDGTII